ncbi:hypothetical protein Tco_1229669 [Tanacetum coccineum]
MGLLSWGSRKPKWTVRDPDGGLVSYYHVICQSTADSNTRVKSSSTLGIPVDTTAAAITSARANPDLADPSQPEESKGSDDSFYEPPTLDPFEAKRWYVPRWNITNYLLLDDGFSFRALVDRFAPPAFFSTLRTMDYDQMYTEFNVGSARQICLGAEVRSRAEHELELKEKLRAKYAARGRLLEEKDLKILRLKSQLAEKEAETAEVIRLRDQVSSLSGEKSALTAEVSVLKVTVTQKDHDISLLNSRATCLASTLDDAKVACAEAGNKITSLASERDRLASEDFKEKMEIQQEEQAHELYNCVAELEAHVMDVSGRLEGEFYPAYLTTLAERRWLLTHGIPLALLKCLKSPEYQGILGYALGRVVDFGMQEGLEAGYEHGISGRNLFAVNAYNPEVGKASYINAVKALEDVDFPKLLESTQHCFMSLVIPAAGGSSSAAVAEVSAPTEEGQENVAPEDAYLELADLDEGTTAVRQGEEELRIDHPTLVSGTGGKTLAGLEQIRPVCSRLSAREQLAFPSVAPSSKESECLLDSSAQTNLRIRTTVESSSTLGIPVDTTTTATTFTRAAVTTRFATDGQAECVLGRGRLGHGRSMNWSLHGKGSELIYARGRLLEEKDLEILKLKSQLAEKEVEAAEKDHDIYLLNSCATCLASTLDDAKVACAKAGNKITSLASKRDRLVSEVLFRKWNGDSEDEQALEVSKKDVGIDEVLDYFLLDGPFAGLSEAADLQPCIEQLSIYYHSEACCGSSPTDDGNSFRSSIFQTWVGEASTSVASLSIEDYDEEDTDEALGSVVAIPKLETCHF